MRALKNLAIDVTEAPNPHEVLPLSRKHKLTFYDAACLELGKRECLALATLGADLGAAAHAEGFPFI
jgi:hypothetical protein